MAEAKGTKQAIQPREGKQQAGEKSLARRRGSLAPSLWSDSPFGLMNRFASDMERLFEDFGFGWSLNAPLGRRGLWPRGFAELEQAAWSPQMEVFEQEGKFMVRADLPGLNKDDVKVEITDDAVIVQGERKHEHEECDESFCHSERSFGRFYRSISLPDGADADNAKADFRNGVLEISIPVPERQQRRRRIEVGESAKAKAQTTGKS